MILALILSLHGETELAIISIFVWIASWIALINAEVVFGFSAPLGKPIYMNAPLWKKVIFFIVVLFAFVPGPG